MIRVVHIFHALPEKYASAYMTFANAELGRYCHEFIGMRHAADAESHASSVDATIAPQGWLARYRFFRETCRHAMPTVVLFHGMFHGAETLALWLALFARTDLAYRAAWVIWGGDLYEFQQPARSFSSRIRRALHRALAGRFHYIAASTPGDLEVAHVRLNASAIKLPSLYINPLPFIRDVPPPVPSRTVVMLGNSADPTNEHLAGLEELARIDSGFEVLCPLSYSGSEEYVAEVVAKGKSLFGERFRPLLTLMSATEYSAIIDDVSYAVFRHNRQQALGNVLSLLYEGKQVFMREDTTGFRFFADIGLDVRPLDSLRGDTLAKPVAPDTLAVESQRRIIRAHFGVPRATALWTQLIDRISSHAPKHD